MADYTAQDYGYVLTGDTGAMREPISDIFNVPNPAPVFPIGTTGGFIPEDTGGQPWSQWFQNAANVLISARLTKQGVTPATKTTAGGSVVFTEGSSLVNQQNMLIFGGLALAGVLVYALVTK